QRHGRHRPRGERRPPVPHLPAGRRPGRHEELPPQRPPRGDRRPEGRRDRGGARVTTTPAPPPDPAKARLDRQLKHRSPLIGCRFDPYGRFLFVSAQDATLQRFDLLTGAKVAFAGHASWVRGMAFVPQADELTAHVAIRTGLLGLAGGWGALAAPPRPLPF